VFYSVKEKNFEERGNRRQTDREFSKRAELEMEIARQREEYVTLFPKLSLLCLNISYRTAKKAQDDELATKTSSRSSSKIIVPGTPRHSGVGSGLRVLQTPRRRVGL
jgi:pre-mRNA-splicing factor ATP-dependent RNA helicase DHX38/PRP16